MAGATQTVPPPRVVLIDAEEITDIDATAIITMNELNRKLEVAGVDLRFANVRAGVIEIMRSAGFEEAIGPEYFYISVQTGVDAYLREQAAAQASAETAPIQDGASPE